MPVYLTQHTLACLTRQGAETLAQRMMSGGTARAGRVLVNMLEGKMFVEFRAEWCASSGRLERRTASSTSRSNLPFCGHGLRLAGSPFRFGHQDKARRPVGSKPRANRVADRGCGRDYASPAV
jgi:hypothetical protein